MQRQKIATVQHCVACPDLVARSCLIADEALLSAKASLHQELRGVRRGKSLLKIVIIRAHDIVR